jgi:hypothetical protein
MNKRMYRGERLQPATFEHGKTEVHQFGDPENTETHAQQVCMTYRTHNVATWAGEWIARVMVGSTLPGRNTLCSDLGVLMEASKLVNKLVLYQFCPKDQLTGWHFLC